MGDPACFLDQTCITCGRVLEPAQRLAGICICGEPIEEHGGQPEWNPT
ncbi:MAG TPA: hypothetical protein VFV13_11385 [Acidimicrobiia bacterium]|nr:hypothetical protein [Acidimicrobiia bacterium]